LNSTKEGSEFAVQGRKRLESSPGWQEIRREFLATGDSSTLGRALTGLVETAAIEAYQASLAQGQASPSVLLAAGSFARGELFPYSHPDILVVRDGSLSRSVSNAPTEFVRELWIRGVLPRQRICSVADCLVPPERSVDLQARLLDRRVLAGDSGLAARLEGELSAYYARYGQAIAERLIASARVRQDKFLNTPSHKEPDVLNGPGGIHDLRVLNSLRRLCAERIEPVEMVETSAAFVALVRAFLHYCAEGDRNVLDQAAQSAISAQFAPGIAPERWMRGFFKHLRTTFHATRRALDLCAPSIGAASDVDTAISNAEFWVVGKRVYFRNAADAGDESVLRLLEFIGRTAILPAPETEQILETWRPAFPPGWSGLKSLLSLPQASKALRVLENTGTLPAIVPEWTRVEGLIAAGADHDYTLDEHALLAVERICDLRDASDAPRQRFCQLLPEPEEQSLLLFAILFHRMCGDEEADWQPAIAAAVARQAATRVGMPPPDQEFVSFLIQEQNSLPDAIGGRDLDDPAIVRSLAERIGTIERLRALTVLTYADLTATYYEPIMLWRLDQLWRAYQSTLRELTRELESDRIENIPQSLVGSSDFITGFPTRYLRAHSAEEIRAHIQLHEVSRSTGVAVKLEPVEGTHRMTVVAQDRPALFASFAGAISSFGLNIVRAEAYSNSKGVILDTFTLIDPKRTLSLNPTEADRLQDLMLRIALGKTDARKLFRKPPGSPVEKGAIEPRIQFDSEACETATLVEIVAADRPGLLYSLASVFSSNRCDIDTVLIDTKGHRAIDVFYVAHQGRKLSPDLQASLERELAAACGGPTAG
jgi:[protein-PII] uridylyltransferase